MGQFFTLGKSCFRNVQYFGQAWRYFLFCTYSLLELHDIYYQWNVNRYDLNKDGLFNGEEITREQNQAMQKLINDVGRNFSFVTGLIFAALVSGAVYIIGQLNRFVKIKRNKNHTQQQV